MLCLLLGLVGEGFFFLDGESAGRLMKWVLWDSQVVVVIPVVVCGFMGRTLVCDIQS